MFSKANGNDAGQKRITDLLNRVQTGPLEQYRGLSPIQDSDQVMGVLGDMTLRLASERFRIRRQMVHLTASLAFEIESSERANTLDRIARLSVEHELVDRLFHFSAYADVGASPADGKLVLRQGDNGVAAVLTKDEQNKKKRRNFEMHKMVSSSLEAAFGGEPVANEPEGEFNVGDLEGTIMASVERRSDGKTRVHLHGNVPDEIRPLVEHAIRSQFPGAEVVATH